MGPTRNYDLAFGNSAQCDGDNHEGWQFVCGEDRPPPDGLPVPFWWRKLTGNAAFRRRLSERWSVLKSEGEVFDLVSIQDFIDQQSDRLKAHGAVVRNERVWNVLWRQVPPGLNDQPVRPENPTDQQIKAAYDGEVKKLSDWFPVRTNWMDASLPGMTNYYNFQEGSGTSGGAMGVADSAALIIPLALTLIVSFL